MQVFKVSIIHAWKAQKGPDTQALGINASIKHIFLNNTAW